MCLQKKKARTLRKTPEDFFTRGEIKSVGNYNDKEEEGKEDIVEIEIIDRDTKK